MIYKTNRNNRKQSKKRKRVQFALGRQQQQQREAAPAVENHKELWWQKDEVSLNLMSACSVAESVRNGCDHVLLFRANNANNNAAVSAHHPLPALLPYDATLLSIHRACRDIQKRPDSWAKRNLLHWASMTHARRGLEKISVPDLGTERSHQRNHLVTSVVLIHKRCLKEGIKQDVAEELIRATSESQSIGAKRFASIMGVADAVAAAQATIEDNCKDQHHQ